MHTFCGVNGAPALQVLPPHSAAAAMAHPVVPQARPPAGPQRARQPAKYAHPAELLCPLHQLLWLPPLGRGCLVAALLLQVLQMLQVRLQVLMPPQVLLLLLPLL